MSAKNVERSEILCNGDLKIGKSDHLKDTSSHNTGRNDCKPLSYHYALDGRIGSVPEFFGSDVQSHDTATDVGRSCGSLLSSTKASYIRKKGVTTVYSILSYIQMHWVMRKRLLNQTAMRLAWSKSDDSEEGGMRNRCKLLHCI